MSRPNWNRGAGIAPKGPERLRMRWGSGNPVCGPLHASEQGVSKRAGCEGSNGPVHREAVKLRFLMEVCSGPQRMAHDWKVAFIPEEQRPFYGLMRELSNPGRKERRSIPHRLVLHSSWNDRRSADLLGFGPAQWIQDQIHSGGRLGDKGKDPLFQLAPDLFPPDTVDHLTEGFPVNPVLRYQRQEGVEGGNDHLFRNPLSHNLPQPDLSLGAPPEVEKIRKSPLLAEGAEGARQSDVGDLVLCAAVRTAGDMD